MLIPPALPVGSSSRRRVVRSGPIRGDWRGHGSRRGSNMFAGSDGERRPTARVGQRRGPRRGGPALTIRRCRRFLRWSAWRQCVPLRDGPLWTTLHAVGWCGADQSGAIGGATGVDGDRTCLQGQMASVAPPRAWVNVEGRVAVGRRSPFGGAGVSSGGPRRGSAFRYGMGRSGPPYTP
jgi:hypothetical protein